jgi:hypothetical protein
MSIGQAPATRRRPQDRFLLWLGTVIALGASVAYLIQILVLKRLTTPLYLDVLGWIALIAVVVAMIQAPSLRRALVAVPIAVIAGAEIWIVTIGSALPSYQGPLGSGLVFPSFAAERTNGGSFTEADLRGQPTLLTFFRGRW